MKVAIMQPYVFPYIGYFQLINAVDTFVFYDDVNFIKGGWINRNHILVNKKKNLFSFPIENMSSFKLISETKISQKSLEKSTKKLLRTIEQSYKKAPFFATVFPIISNFLSTNACTTISEFAIDSVKLISEYLELNTKFVTSSSQFAETIHLKKESRLTNISKQLNALQYINPIGGLELYDRSNFAKHHIALHFIKSKPIDYVQFDNEFVPWLSIIDVLMFNSKDIILTMLNEYELV